MLEHMFVGKPPGNYDRILDFSMAVSGCLFFIPTATFLDSVTEDAPLVSSAAAATTGKPTQPTPSERAGSLGIGSLKGDIPHE